MSDPSAPSADLQKSDETPAGAPEEGAAESAQDYFTKLAAVKEGITDGVITTW